MSLKERIFEALDNAVENGYDDDFRAMGDLELAVDLVTYSSDLEDEEPEDLVPFIAEYRKEKGW